MTRKKGFTLIELLVVIAIIGILATIVMASLGGAKAKGRDAKRISDIRNIQLALSLYYNDNLFYPKNIYAAYDASNGVTPAADGLMGEYMAVVPADPNDPGSGATHCTTSGSQANCYRYIAMSTTGGACTASGAQPSMYHLGAIFEDDNNSALSQDVDANSSSMSGFSACTTSGSGAFPGNTPTCSGTQGTTPDKCYDQTP